MVERPELFAVDDTVYVGTGQPWRPRSCAPLTPAARAARPRLLRIHSRPGILVLINDVDWELEGKLEYELEEGDTISFISTLHGG